MPLPHKHVPQSVWQLPSFSPHCASQTRLPHWHAPVHSLELGLHTNPCAPQSLHTSPLLPQALGALPGAQLPLGRQQPLGQVSGPHSGLPPEPPFPPEPPLPPSGVPSRNERLQPVAIKTKSTANSALHLLRKIDIERRFAEPWARDLFKSDMASTCRNKSLAVFSGDQKNCAAAKNPGAEILARTESAR